MDELTLQKLKYFKDSRDMFRQELTHRKIFGRRYLKGFLTVSDAEIEEELQWYKNAIEEIVSAEERKVDNA